MKLASLRERGPDGSLILVSQDLSHATKVTDIAETMQDALDGWSAAEMLLKERYEDLNQGRCENQFKFDFSQCLAPLPRSYQFLDGSAYVHHVELARKSRGAEMPESFWKEPLMYQACSDRFMAWNDPIQIADETYGYDFEAEVAILCHEVPMGTPPAEAEHYIALVTLLNDVSLRNLIAPELSKGFGFVQSKPHSSCAPLALSLDELRDYWSDAKLNRPMLTQRNGSFFGKANAGQDMVFNFAELIAHASKTRSLAAGTIIASGTVSNKSGDVGSSCIVERRMLEKINDGEVSSSYLKFGDRVQMEMKDDHGQTLFGEINQIVMDA